MAVLRSFAAWRSRRRDQDRPSRVGRILGKLRARFRKPAPPPMDPTLPRSAQLVAIQHPSVTLPERPFDLWLLVAVLGLLGIGTIEIYSATAGEAVTASSVGPQIHESAHFLQRQLLYVSMGAFQPAIHAALDTVAVGTVSSVIENPIGFNVFKVNDRKPERTYTFEEVKDQLPGAVEEIKDRERWDTWLKTLRAKSHIEIRGS